MIFSAPAPAEAEQLGLFAAPANPYSNPIGVSTYTGPISAPAGVPPTGEQQAIIDAFKAGSALVVAAGAGTGKTSTLRMLSMVAGHRRGLYVAYNASVAREARGKFPAAVDCRTAHSLAFEQIGQRYAHRLPQRGARNDDGPRRLPATEVARILGLRGEQLGDRFLTGPALARLADQTVANYCRSAAEDIMPEHVPDSAGLNGRGWADMVAVLVPAARKLWADLCNPNGKLWFEHDHYLKMWSLDDPILRADYVMLDEAQDADPVIAYVVGRQRTETGAQLIYVGDQSQAIYGWRGAVDAMSTFNGRRLQLTQSFRFGQPVADEANAWLDLLGADLRLTGTERVASRLGYTEAPNAILCRTNGGAIGAVLDMLEAGRRVALVGGGREIKAFAYAAKDLMAGRPCSLPELAAFRTWRELCEYVEDERAGADLKVRVKMVQRYGPGTLIDTINRLTPERRGLASAGPAPEVTVSTAHKAKGLEWPAVRIGDDFAPPEDGDEPERAELMLAYVACTRAQNALDVGSLSWRRYGYVDPDRHWFGRDSAGMDLPRDGG